MSSDYPTEIEYRAAVADDVFTMSKIDILERGKSYSINFWEDNLDINHSFVAIFNKEIVGYICSNDITIVSFDIMKEYRNQGIGKELLSKCIQTYDFYVNLNVRISNLVAIHLYESFGFKIVGIIDDYYDPKEDAYSMELCKK